MKGDKTKTNLIWYHQVKDVEHGNKI